MSAAEGSVKPTHAAAAPGSPAFARPDADAHLAGGRPRQHLAKRDEIRIGAVLDPAPARDEGLAKIADVRHRPAERGEPQQEKGP